MVVVRAFSGSEPQLYRPRPPLADYIDFFGYWRRDSGDPHQSRALPRGAATVIIDVGGRQRIDFYAYDGRTRLHVPPAFIAGVGTTSYITHIDAAQTVLTIHFRPARALPFLGIPMGELENSCVGLTDVWGREGGALHEQLVASASATERIALLQSFLLHRLHIHDAEPHQGVMGVLRAIEHDASMRVSQAHRLPGSHRRSWWRRSAPRWASRPRRISGCDDFRPHSDGSTPRPHWELPSPPIWAYFDQAHFVREFRSFTSMTPTQYVQRRSWLPSHVETAGHGRNIQASRRPHAHD